MPCQGYTRSGFTVLAVHRRSEELIRSSDATQFRSKSGMWHDSGRKPLTWTALSAAPAKPLSAAETPAPSSLDSRTRGGPTTMISPLITPTQQVTPSQAPLCAQNKPPPKLSSKSPALPLPMLPADVWQYIFSFISARPRLMVCSLVCKRWRQAVLRSIRSHVLPRSGTDLMMLTSLLENLTSLSTGAMIGISAPLPSTLRNLSVFDQPAHSPASFTALQSLTSLRLICRFGGECAAVIFRVSTALQSLDYRFMPTDSSSTCSYTEDAYFPHLTELRCVTTRAPLQHLFARHASQLRSMSYEEGMLQSLPKEMWPMCFPALTNLTATLYTPFDDEMKEFLAATCSKLTALHLTLPLGLLSSIASLIAPVLKTLKLEQPELPGAEMIDASQLLPFTRLTRLSYSPSYVLNSLSNSIREGITHLNVAHATLAISFLDHFPNLVWLVFACRGLTKMSRVSSLPKLKHLDWREAELRLALFTERILDGCPSLTSLTLHPGPGKMKNFLSEMEKRGLQRLTLHYTGEPSWSIDTRAFRWLRVHVQHGFDMDSQLYDLPRFKSLDLL